MTNLIDIRPHGTVDILPRERKRVVIPRPNLKRIQLPHRLRKIKRQIPTRSFPRLRPRNRIRILKKIPGLADRGGIHVDIVVRQDPNSFVVHARE